MLKQFALIVPLIGLSIPLKASFDFKHTAEDTTSVQLAVAVAGQYAVPASAAAAAGAATRLVIVAPGLANLGKEGFLNPHKNVLSRALENNNITFIKKYFEYCPGMKRKQAFREAAQMKRDDILLALVPEKKANEPQEHSFKQYFFAQESLTPLDIKIYHYVLGLIGQKEEDNFKQITKYLKQKTLLGIHALAQLTAQMLYPTLRKDEEVIAITHPELECAINAGDQNKVAALAQSGWVTKGQGQGLGALSLAVDVGQRDIVYFLLENMPLIDAQERKRLLTIAKEKKEFFKNKIDAEELYKKYEKIFEFLTRYDTSNYHCASSVRVIDDVMMQAVCERQDPGSLLRALEEGANQNVIFYDAGKFPYTVVGNSLSPDMPPSLIQIFTCDKNFNPAGTVWDPDGKNKPLLLHAITKNLPEHTQILLDAGCDPNAVNADGLPIVWQALNQNDLNIFQVLIDSSKLDRHTTVKDRDGKPHPLLFWAIYLNKPFHARLLLNAGFDPNAFDGFGNPIAWIAMNSNNPDDLQMLIDTKKLDLNALVAIENGRDAIPLVSYAIWKKKPHAAQALLDAGCNPNVTDSRGRSAMKYAKDSPNPDYLRMIQEQKKTKEEPETCPASAAAGAGQERARPAAAATAVGGKRKAPAGNGESNKQARRE